MKNNKVILVSEASKIYYTTSDVSPERIEMYSRLIKMMWYTDQDYSLGELISSKLHHYSDNLDKTLLFNMVHPQITFIMGEELPFLINQYIFPDETNKIIEEVMDKIKKYWHYHPEKQFFEILQEISEKNNISEIENLPDNSIIKSLRKEGF